MSRAVAVVPGYYLVCYNRPPKAMRINVAVVPGYYLVCYNISPFPVSSHSAVVPGYYLVCYNRRVRKVYIRPL